MPQVRYSRQADRDLAGIWDYIAHDNPRAAASVLRAIARKAELIATQPHLGRTRPELAAGLRSFSQQHYVIFYQPIAGGIEIVRILHDARDMDTAFEE